VNASNLASENSVRQSRVNAIMAKENGAVQQQVIRVIYPTDGKRIGLRTDAD